jgi:hypothetical protein
MGLDRPVSAAQTPLMPVAPLPRRGGVHADRRDQGRALRVSAHDELGLVTLSIWRGNACVATHQLATEDVPALIESLARALVPGAASEATEAS